MTIQEEFRGIEIALEEKGLSENVRKRIRNLRICAVDDNIDDLKSLIIGLNSEGFQNIKEYTVAPSVNDIVKESFDLILLDLDGIAKEKTEKDGVGVFEGIRKALPTMPVIIITGKPIIATDSKIIANANKIITKPIKSIDLVADIDSVLREIIDPLWAAMAVLKELNHISNEINTEIGVFQKFKLWKYKNDLKKKVLARSTDTIDRIVSIAGIIAKTGALGLRIIAIAKGVKTL